MPTAKPRLTITFPPELYGVLSDLAELRGVSKSAVVTEMLEAAMPVMQRVSTILRAARDADRGALEQYVDSLEQAEQTLSPLLAAAIDQLDLPLPSEPPPSNTGVTSPTVRPPKTPAKGAKAPSRAASSKGKRS
jgi:hypothetical protein